MIRVLEQDRAVSRLTQLPAKRAAPQMEVVQLDLDRAADETREVLGARKRPLDPGGPDLQHVAAGHHVLGLEITADLLVPVCAIGYRDAGRTVQGYPNNRPTTRLGGQLLKSSSGLRVHSDLSN